MRFTCPVCYFAALQEPATPYNICDCCGTEFGVDDEFRSHAELRAAWIHAGARWFFRTPPVGWNPWAQLYSANVAQVPFAAPIAYYGGGVSLSEQSFDATYESYVEAA